VTSDRPIGESLQVLALDRHDEDAWRVLFRHMWPFTVTVCGRLLGGDVDAAQEAAQESLARLARYAPFGDLQEPAAFRAYARTVCRRVVHARYRERGATLLVSIESSEVLASDDLDPEQEAGVKTLFESILAELDRDGQRLLRMTVAGYSLSEIARELGITYQAAGVRVHRVRKRLRKWL
jgi:RNA polymerase sigma factor (sigma-70 family)